MLSPNFNRRTSGIALDYIILHYTGMKDAAMALTRLRDPTAQVSAHYLIDEDGTITPLVDEANRAWHAGQSFWRGITDLNSASIGIELVNPGHEFGYRPFPPPQIAALKKLLPKIIARHTLNAVSCLLAHSDIAPARKQDPGELFPWQELAQEGLGLWPELKAADDKAMTETEATFLLSTIGYDTTTLHDALRAFQRRYCPASLTGNLDSRTAAFLRALRADPWPIPASKKS